MIPEDDLFAVIGRGDEGIKAKIREGLSNQFPNKAAPDFGPLRDDEFLVYAYQESRLVFALQYGQSRKALRFTDSHGRSSEIHSIGYGPDFVVSTSMNALRRSSNSICVIRRTSLSSRSLDRTSKERRFWSTSS